MDLTFRNYFLQLFSIIVCVMRNLIDILHSKVLRLEAKLIQDAFKSNSNNRSLIAALMNAELVFGRIVWLICNDYAQHKNLKTLVQLNVLPVGSGVLMTEYQFQSAFEIIDVNGDGYLNTEEVGEVFQVLAMDQVQHSILVTIESLNLFLSEVFVSTTHWFKLSYDELLLCCSNEITSTAPSHLHLHKLLVQLFSDKIYYKVIDYWVLQRKTNEFVLFYEMLVKELYGSMEHLVTSEYLKDKDYVGNYKLSFQFAWKLYKVENQSEEGGISTCPVAISSSLYMYLLDCAALFVNNWVSFDVISTNNTDLIVVSRENFNVSSQTLLQYIVKKMCDQIITSYSNLNAKFEQMEKLIQEKCNGLTIYERLFENICLQVLFDVMYLIQFVNAAMAQLPLNSRDCMIKMQNELQSMLSLWINRVDPVTYSLISTEYLTPNVRRYFLSISALLHCFVGNGTGGDRAILPDQLSSAADTFDEVFVPTGNGANALGSFGMLSIPVSLVANTNAGNTVVSHNSRIPDSQSSHLNSEKSLNIADNSSMLSRAIGSLW